MEENIVELNLYADCLYDIKRRIEVIADHINEVYTEKFMIVEVETICLQFRKILENIALISLVANKKLYAEQHEKFAKHYHAKLIMKDLERINPNFYPVPTRLVTHKDKMSEWVHINHGFLTKDELIEIYEKCGGMLHAQNPFSAPKPVKEIRDEFPKWLDKICILLNHHQIKLVGGDLMVVAVMNPEGRTYPQAVLFEKADQLDEGSTNEENIGIS